MKGSNLIILLKIGGYSLSSITNGDVIRYRVDRAPESIGVSVVAVTRIHTPASHPERG